MPPRSFKPLRAVALRALAWLLPAFVLWWFLLTPVLMPVLERSTDFLLHNSFDKMQARVVRQDNGEWHISTQVLMKKQPANPKKRHMLNLHVQRNIAILTFGLPVLWALLLAIPYHRPRNLIFGTSLVTLGFILTAWLLFSHQLILSLAGKQAHYVFISASIKHRIDPFALWQVELLGLLLKIALYTVAFLLPASLAYLLNRTWWHDVFHTPLPEKANLDSNRATI